MNKILLTGVAGFIGYNLSKRLLEDSFSVVGIDNINDYYDTDIKYQRLSELGIPSKNILYTAPIKSQCYPHFKFVKADLQDFNSLDEIFAKEQPDIVINLAAQAGVRESLEKPELYTESNIVGFGSILHCCFKHSVKHLIYASSSSVYGGCKKMPLCEDDITDAPLSYYAVTKRTNELMATYYSQTYDLISTGLRLFTVYGPNGRPDMAPMLFAKAITEGKPINIFNNGDMIRDFTYIDDIVECIVRVINKKVAPKNLEEKHKIYNIGSSNPIKLMDFIKMLESNFGQEAEKKFLPIQPGDVYQTYAAMNKFENDFGYKPVTTIGEGVMNFTNWYSKYILTKSKKVIDERLH